MKKLIFIFIILILTSVLLTSSSCFIQENIALNKAKEDEKIEFNKTKEEIIKFDEEYNKINNELKDETQIIVKDLATKNYSDKTKLEIDLAKKIWDQYLNYENKFKKINMPEPLDEFYYKKLEYIQEMMKAFSAFQNSPNDSSASIYLDNAEKLNLEADKLKREVYREYGLDDLINK